jgi:hypothetical protein
MNPNTTTNQPTEQADRIIIKKTKQPNGNKHCCRDGNKQNQPNNMGYSQHDTTTNNSQANLIKDGKENKQWVRNQ